MSRPVMRSMDIASVLTQSPSILDLGPRPLMECPFQISSTLGGRYILSLYDPAFNVPITVPVSTVFFPLDDITVELAIGNDLKPGVVEWVRDADRRVLVVRIPPSSIRR